MNRNKFLTEIQHKINKSMNFSTLAATYALEIDRIFRINYENTITFSLNEFSSESIDTARDIGLLLTPSINTEKVFKNIIFQAEKLAYQKKISSAISFAFENAVGPEVNSLNIIYANYATSRSDVRLYFINKYLSAYKRSIKLGKNKKNEISNEFFSQIESATSFTKFDGLLVTIIVPAFNAEKTIRLAVNSLLNQSWRNIQLIIVDDASTDNTLEIAKEYAENDSRVEVVSNATNVGPYVSRNLGVLRARGEWLTVHDADDWAFPDRIEQQVNALIDTGATSCTCGMLRMNTQGQVTRASQLGNLSIDGYQRLCFSSLLVQTSIFRKKLGAWDSVRVSADSEMLDRINVLGLTKLHLNKPLLLCLDHDLSLTNNPELGLGNEVRLEYASAYKNWHSTDGEKILNVFNEVRPFLAPENIEISPKSIYRELSNRKKIIEKIKASPLFDEQWYREQYPQFEKSGNEAAEHYLLFGAIDRKDPGPDFCTGFYLDTHPGSWQKSINPLIRYHGKGGGQMTPERRCILQAAHKISQTGQHELALKMAEIYLPEDLSHTAEILKANAALAKKNETEWVGHLNNYLEHFGSAPIELKTGSDLLARLSTRSLPAVTGGPLITVIMPAWNAEKTLRAAARSILNQTWKNLELLIIDDASVDGTWSVMKDIAVEDDRVKIMRNKINVGPYVSKNKALSISSGEWITGHDADDWAHPQRIEQHYALANQSHCDASLTYMLRIQPSGEFNHLSLLGDMSVDGVARKAMISTLFKSNFLKQRLGYWDSVRFGADSEIISRARILLGDRFLDFPKIGLLCLDLESNLTNNPITGTRTETGLSPARKAYKDAWSESQKKMSLDDLYLPFPVISHRYKSDCNHFVSVGNIGDI